MHELLTQPLTCSENRELREFNSVKGSTCYRNREGWCCLIETGSNIWEDSDISQPMFRITSQCEVVSAYATCNILF